MHYSLLQDPYSLHRILQLIEITTIGFKQKFTTNGRPAQMENITVILSLIAKTDQFYVSRIMLMVNIRVLDIFFKMGQLPQQVR